MNSSYILHFALFFNYLVASLQEQTPIQDFPPSHCSCNLSEDRVTSFFPVVPAESNSTPRRLHAGDLIRFFGVFLLVLPKESCLGITDSACAKNRRSHCSMHYQSKHKWSNVGSSTIFNFYLTNVHFLCFIPILFCSYYLRYFGYACA